MAEYCEDCQNVIDDKDFEDGGFSCNCCDCSYCSGCSDEYEDYCNCCDSVVCINCNGECSYCKSIVCNDCITIEEDGKNICQDCKEEKETE